MSDGKKTGGFDALLEEIGGLAGETEALAKSVGAEAEGAGEDDAKIAAAADEGDEDGDDEDKELLGKSFMMTLDDGTQVPAVDGTALVKALIGRVERVESEGLGALVGLVKAQGALIKSMAADLTALKAGGRGRKAVLAITERPAPAETELKKSQGDGEGGMTGEQFLAKAMAAQAAGRITARDIALAETCVGMGQQPPKALVAAVLNPA